MTREFPSATGSGLQLLTVPPGDAQQLLAPASLLQKALRRGCALSATKEPLLHAMAALLSSGSCAVSELGYQVRPGSPTDPKGASFAFCSALAILVSLESADHVLPSLCGSALAALQRHPDAAVEDFHCCHRGFLPLPRPGSRSATCSSLAPLLLYAASSDLGRLVDSPSSAISRHRGTAVHHCPPGACPDLPRRPHLCIAAVGC